MVKAQLTAQNITINIGIPRETFCLSHSYLQKIAYSIRRTPEEKVFTSNTEARLYYFSIFRNFFKIVYFYIKYSRVFLYKTLKAIYSKHVFAKQPFSEPQPEADFDRRAKTISIMVSQTPQVCFTVEFLNVQEYISRPEVAIWKDAPGDSFFFATSGHEKYFQMSKSSTVKHAQ